MEGKKLKKTGKKKDRIDKERSPTSSISALIDKLKPEALTESAFRKTLKRVGEDGANLLEEIKTLTIIKPQLPEFMALVFEKAMDKPAFQSDCAEILEIFRSKVCDDSFCKNVLIDLLQKEFGIDQLTSKIEERESVNSYEQLTVKYHQIPGKICRRRLKCTMFVGELVKQGMLSEIFLLDCLLSLNKFNDKESIACLCYIVETTLSYLNKKKYDEALERVFVDISNKYKSKGINMISKSKLLDILKFREKSLQQGLQPSSNMEEVDLSTLTKSDVAGTFQKQVKEVADVSGSQTMLIQAVPKMIEDGCPAERKLEPSAEHVEGKFSDEPGPSMEPIVRQGRESLIVDSYDAQNRGDIEFSNPFQSTFSTTPFHSEARPAAIVHSPVTQNIGMEGNQEFVNVQSVLSHEGMKHKKKQYRIHKVDNPMGAEGGSEVKNKNELAVNDPMFELEEMDESTSSSTCIEIEMDKARLQMFGNMLKLIGGVEKFSLEKFKRLQVTRRELPKFMALVFEKAIDKPTFQSDCAEILAIIGSKVCDDSLCKNVLIYQLQREFPDTNFPNTMVLMQDNKYEQFTLNYRDLTGEICHNRLKCATFAGELVKMGMLSEIFVMHCLLSLTKYNDTDSIECLCYLVRTTLSYLNKTQYDEALERLFRDISNKARNKVILLRTRMKLREILKFREQNKVADVSSSQTMLTQAAPKMIEDGCPVERKLEPSAVGGDFSDEPGPSMEPIVRQTGKEESKKKIKKTGKKKGRIDKERSPTSSISALIDKASDKPEFQSDCAELLESGSQTMLTQAAPKMIEDGCPVERKLEPSAIGGDFSDEPGPSMEPIVRQGRESLIVDSYDAQNRGDIEFSNPFQSTFSTTPFHSEARPAATVHSPVTQNIGMEGNQEFVNVQSVLSHEGMKHKKKQYRIHKVDNPMGAEGGSEVKNKNELAVNDPMFELEEMDESTSSSTCIETMLTQAAPKMIEDGCPVERKLEPSAVGGMEFSDEPGPSMEPIVRQGRESSIVNSYDAQNRGDIEFSNPGEFQETFSTTPIPSEARPAATIHLPATSDELKVAEGQSIEESEAAEESIKEDETRGDKSVERNSYFDKKFTEMNERMSDLENQVHQLRSELSILKAQGLKEIPSPKIEMDECLAMLAETFDIVKKGRTSVIKKGKIGNEFFFVRQIDKIYNKRATNEIFAHEKTKHSKNILQLLLHFQSQRSYYLVMKSCQWTLEDQDYLKSLSLPDRISLCKKLCEETSIHLIVDDASELFITNLRRSQFQNHDGFGNATTAWCSPEMQFGSSKISNKTDVYSAGLLIYSILTGETNSDKLKKNMQVQKLPKFSAHLLSKMTSEVPEERPEADKLVCHPLFWDHTTFANYFTNLSCVLGSNPNKSTINMLWTEKVDEKTMKIFESKRRGKRKYENTLQGFVRFVRNMIAHVGEMEGLPKSIPEAKEFVWNNLEEAVLRTYELNE